MNSSPPMGAIAFGKSGVGYPVIEVHPDRIVLKKDGEPWAVNLVAIARWELPHPFPVGSIVHKRFNHGWTGIVLKLIGSDSVEVLWWLNKLPTLIRVSELRPADDEISRRYRATPAFRDIVSLKTVLRQCAHKNRGKNNR